MAQSEKNTTGITRTVHFNESVADVLRDIANVLAAQDANPFRINAYRRAADIVAAHNVDLRELVDHGGREGLLNLPFIGHGLAATIEEIITTGRSAQLDRLRGATDPETLFRTVPGIGPVLAKQLHDRLHVDTLEGLEVAARDGRLTKVAGVGPRRAAAITASLQSLLDHRPMRASQRSVGPDVSDVLDVDREYRLKAAAGSLPMITPGRFNAKNEAWLPILHTDRNGWHFTALFSNTARAHELGRTHDWVVLYFYDGDHREGQHTVVTETRGADAGRRVVRGRERECGLHYRERASR